MELLMNLLPGVVAYAADGINSEFFGVLKAGANTFVGIIRFAALLYVLVKIAALGFKISTTAKSSSEAIKLVKDEGLALFIGLLVVLTAFMIHGAMQDTIGAIDGNKTEESIEYSDKDIFN